jgi:diaminohydroxyphosphoribosylaminopyrimidine deaminase / 5-amino-6-(5-phosphoribosylamino)uracil reductase
MQNPEERFMRRAIALSRRGYPAPNPHVGCVIVRDGEVVGEGWHKHAGGPHAEVEALRAAGPSARGATAYVTLEPCNHHGRTPPCSEALIQAGLARVVVACSDPNPKAAGGMETLAAHGIATDAGLLSAEAFEVNVRFLTAMRERRPYIVLKAACSLDGRIALPDGSSKWITNEQSRRMAHRLRADMGAVLVGRRTVERDDPHLTARIPGVKNQPVRVVLDPHQRLKGEERVFDNAAPTKHITLEHPAAHPDGIALPRLMESLHKDGITGVLVEGGATTIGTFLQARLFDRIELFVAPKILGSGTSWVEGLSIGSIDESDLIRVISQKRLGSDLWITAVRKFYKSDP